MGKYKKNYWNYRIVTQIFKGRKSYDMKDGSNKDIPDERIFSIVEVYYHDGKPDSYADSKGILLDHESVEDLKWVHKKIKKAFKQPILDLDNFPNKWIDDKKKE
jgi:hypothetical protein